MDEPTSNTYGQILKSTTLVGGSQLVNILFSIVRTKFLAVLLGPSGFGLMGMYSAILGTVGTFAGMGIGSSGVRQIAEAAGAGDEQKIARTIITLRRTVIFTGLLGMLLTIIFCVPLSKLTFGSDQYAIPIAILSVTLLMGSISSGQTALIQGLRRIADIARLSVWSAFGGTVMSIPMIYLWGREGIVPFLVTVSATTILTSWWYARKIPVANISLGFRETFKEAKGLLSLGLVFMATGLMSAAVMYLIRILIIRKLGMDSVGLYQSAATLSTLYIGVILGAMDMDFYPRLTAVAKDENACNRMVNEQIKVGLLVAMPGILATLTFASLVIHIFYAKSFIPAYDILRWQILGVFLRVISWPMGFVLVAQGKGSAFFWTELSGNAVHLLLVFAGITYWGLTGTGIAFFGLYIFYAFMMFVVVNHLTGFRWSSFNLNIIIGFSGFIAAVFLMPTFMSQNLALAVNSTIIFGVSAYCLRKIYHLVGPQWFSDFFNKLKNSLGFKKIK